MTMKIVNHPVVACRDGGVRATPRTPSSAAGVRRCRPASCGGCPRRFFANLAAQYREFAVRRVMHREITRCRVLAGFSTPRPGPVLHLAGVPRPRRTVVGAVARRHGRPRSPRRPSLPPHPACRSSSAFFASLAASQERREEYKQKKNIIIILIIILDKSRSDYA